MTPKDILIVVDAAKQEAAFSAAEALVKRWAPHVSCVLLSETPDASLSGARFSTSLWAQLLEETSKRAEQERSDIVKRLSAFVAASEVTVVERSLGGLARVVAERSKHVDLTIMQRPDNDATTAAFEAALFNSGRPVLLAPPGWSGREIGRRVMVAWSATREAVRAVADAAPFLEGAGDITLVTVDASPVYEGDTLDGCDMRTHMARHGLPVSLRQRAGIGRSADLVLLDEARECGADLIVMGGYGHSRIREFVLGGVTRALIRNSPLPLLISH